jgi:hypothetical protein
MLTRTAAPATRTSSASRLQAHADGAIDLNPTDQQELRLAIAHVVRRCRDVIRDIVASSGASVHFLDRELQRIHRDIHMICAHTVFDVDLVRPRASAGPLSPTAQPAPKNPNDQTGQNFSGTVSREDPPARHYPGGIISLPGGPGQSQRIAHLEGVVNNAVKPLSPSTPAIHPHGRGVTSCTRRAGR